MANSVNPGGGDVVQHVSHFPRNAFRDVHTAPCKALQGKVPGTTPRLDADTAYACKVSNDKLVQRQRAMEEQEL